MDTTLPKKLNKEPLIDAGFEVRFISATPVSAILPGYLYGKLVGKKSIEQLPIAQLPKQVRDADPNLKFAPLSRLDWDQFLINIGDYSVSVSCKYPYAGWSAFKPAIIRVMDVLDEIKEVESIERYSMKYVDLISSSDLEQQVSMINFDVTLAGHKLKEENFQLRMEIPGQGLINVIQIISSAKAVLHEGTIKEGLIVDVDTVVNQNNISMQTFLEDISNKLDLIHETNKAMFFECITTETLNFLDPVYE